MYKPGCMTFRLIVGIAACGGLFAFDLSAQVYPVKSVRMLVGFAAGGGTDVTARMVAQKLSEHLGQSVFVENRPGAASRIATERVASSPADGYTLLMMASSGLIESLIRVKAYSIERELAPISLVTIGPLVLVIHPSLPARSVKELIAFARSRPGQLNFGSSGAGSGVHLAGELFKVMAKVNIVHVPYKGSSEAVIANAAGQVELGFPSITAALPLIGPGKLRPLAVTSARRASSLPSLPTLHESGLAGYDRSAWYGLFGPAGLPKDITDRLSGAIGTAVNTPEMKESLVKQGLEVQTNTPEQFAAFIRSETTQIEKLINLAGGVKVQ